MNPRKQVLVTPAAQFEAHRPLFALLADAYPLDFAGGALDDAPGSDGVVAWTRTGAELESLARRGADILALPAPAGPPVPVADGNVAFSPSPEIEACLRGVCMHDRGIAAFVPLALTEPDSVVCSLAALPCWAVRRVDRGRFTITALEPPEVGTADTLYRHCNRTTWLRLLPFLDFAKRLVRQGGWNPPPLRACLMFDDPNLHWESYGFIDYASLATHAAERGYHAAFAMIPADAWYVHPRTAALFRNRAPQLSLLMHGNDHSAMEFALDRTTGEITGLLAQALRRIERFERRSGLPVARVMAPPFGAFRTEVANPMLQLGYDAVCVSRASLTAWNPAGPWRPGFGHGIAEFLGEGLPVIPRQVLAPGHEDTYRLAAFLDQPIIPHGHHRDCADGLEALARTAATINGLGTIQWGGLAEISRSNYQTRRDGDTLHVRMLARRVTVSAPDATIRRIIAVRPWLRPGDEQPETLVCRQGGVIRHAGPANAGSEGFPVAGAGPIDLSSPPVTQLDAHRVAPPARRWWPVLRRLCAEGRDRLAPLLPRPGSVLQPAAAK